MKLLWLVACLTRKTWVLAAPTQPGAPRALADGMAITARKPKLGDELLLARSASSDRKLRSLGAETR